MTTLANPSYRDNTYEAGRAFLLQAARDNQFRQKLASDPRAALEGCGLSIDSARIPSAVTLPPQQDIEKMLAFVDAESDDPDGLVHKYWAGFLG